ncbi:MAG: hypothetical protein KAS93_03275 [Gammaproteobacteria bacterium]|nr:hypothetical protein [Gammaproteobacteria bacterium]
MADDHKFFKAVVWYFFTTIGGATIISSILQLIAHIYTSERRNAIDRGDITTQRELQKSQQSLNHGLIHMKNNNYEAAANNFALARTHCEKIKNKEPDNREIAIQIANLYFQEAKARYYLCQYKEAESLLENASELYGNMKNTESLNLLGCVLINRDNPESALVKFRESYFHNDSQTNVLAMIYFLGAETATDKTNDKYSQILSIIRPATEEQNKYFFRELLFVYAKCLSKCDQFPSVIMDHDRNGSNNTTPKQQAISILEQALYSSFIPNEIPYYNMRSKYIDLYLEILQTYQNQQTINFINSENAEVTLTVSDKIERLEEEKTFIDKTRRNAKNEEDFNHPPANATSAEPPTNGGFCTIL